MGSGDKGQERVFDAFGVGGFGELLGAGDHFGGVGELLGMEGEVPAAESEGAEAGGFLLGYDSAAYAPPLSSSYTLPCFAGGEGAAFQDNGGNSSNNNNNWFSHKSGESCSSSSSSSNSGRRPSNPKPKKKTEQRRAAAGRGRTAAAREATSALKAATPRAAAAAAAATTKKPRKEQLPEQGQQRPPSSQRRTSKVSKERLGERINALQQLVSPFGKTDTASVLHEALGYIRFLHDQVQVLSSPYLQRLPCSATPSDDGEAEARRDLRSRGLCLVPVACTAQVAASNGADLWSPAATESCGNDGDGGDRRHHQHAALSKH